MGWEREADSLVKGTVSALAGGTGIGSGHDGATWRHGSGLRGQWRPSRI